ncbi:hypothetical protein AF335_17335 [Streptomyces eurocidicus]|uniref:Putative membrane protein n=1 Tax=Streptomyces eurocidicus TaxID=66423 RepID=A0A2N8NUC6_STREU|nr:spirocyclase AveC family protein [Streptomyces eurocidicus]MBB5120224.1 putative membrane protein [Streptomyces eurocidicus]MBF6056092.1 spirocyclase, AveC family [Streptomyces eurocidicus]PNE32373.1 hypothetical protein AF335_17335 [Streptomyces eurocidicus]
MTQTQQIRRTAKPRPATVWAVLGAAYAVFQIQLFTRWAANGGLTSGPERDFHISTARATAALVFQGIAVVAILAIAIYVLRECLRRRTVTLNAAVFIGFNSLIWQDPLFDCVRAFVVFNRSVPYVSTWGPYLPGWNNPDAKLLIEPILAPSGLIMGILILWVWGQMALTTWLTRTRPAWSGIRLWTVAVLFGLIVNVVLESLFIVTGMWAYTATTPGTTVFAGHWYQLNLLHALLIAVTVPTPITVMWFHAHRKGRAPHIFRGSETLRPAVRGAVRLLAGVGYLNTWMLVFFVGTNLLAVFGGSMPADMPEYLWPR